MQQKREIEWWTMAASHPLAAMETPHFGFVALFEVERWQKLERLKARSWIVAHIGRLSDPDKQRWCADCAEYAQKRCGDWFAWREDSNRSIAERRAWADNPTHPSRWEALTANVLCSVKTWVYLVDYGADASEDEVNVEFWRKMVDYLRPRKALR